MINITEIKEPLKNFEAEGIDAGDVIIVDGHEYDRIAFAQSVISKIGKTLEE